MSRSGYSEDLDQWDLIRWRGAVSSAIRGHRGQALLREMLQALDAMEPKRLIAHEIVNSDGEACALGVVAKSRGIDVRGIDPESRKQVAEAFDIAPALAAEIAFENDEGSFYAHRETPEQRWTRVRAWVAEQIA